MSRLAVLAVLVALALAGAASAEPACDRACLNRLTDAYMDAMVAKAPGRLPWAPVNGYAENGVRMMAGDALWASITARSPAPIHVADPASGQAVWIGTVEEHGQPGFFALRLKVVDGRIAEAETIVRRKGGPAPFGDPAAWRADPALEQLAPAGRRLARKPLVALADGWFDSLNGPLRTKVAGDCVRRENGVSPEPVGCAAQLKLGVDGWIGKVRARRYPIIDEARGLVVATGVYDFTGRDDSYRTRDGRSRPTPMKYPASQGFITVFKIEGGEIRRVESTLTDLPYRMPAPFGG